jgi:hypothetical protein
VNADPGILFRNVAVIARRLELGHLRRLGDARPKASVIPAQGNALGKNHGISLKANGLSHI